MSKGSHAGLVKEKYIWWMHRLRKGSIKKLPERRRKKKKKDETPHLCVPCKTGPTLTQLWNLEIHRTTCLNNIKPPISWFWGFKFCEKAGRDLVKQGNEKGEEEEALHCILAPFDRIWTVPIVQIKHFTALEPQNPLINEFYLA